MKERTVCEIKLEEVRDGVVEYQLPDDATFTCLMVSNDTNQTTSWGRPPTPGVLEKSYLSSVLKKSWGYCWIVWSAGKLDFQSQRIHVGWNKRNESEVVWEETASRLREIRAYCRERYLIHKRMSTRAKRHLRPKGVTAHDKTALEFSKMWEDLTTYISNKKVGDFKDITDRIEQLKKLEVWANRQDSVNPPPPEQKWYRTNDDPPYLLAQDQPGYNRRPHKMIVGDRCHFYSNGKVEQEVTFCTKDNWNEVARGQQSWKSLSRLDANSLGTSFTGYLYIKVGKGKTDVATFNVPKIVEKSVDRARVMTNKGGKMLEKRCYKRNIKKQIEAQHQLVDADKVMKLFNKKKFNGIQPILLDRKYKVPTYEVWVNILDRNRVDRRFYKPEHFDCDDFAKIIYAYSSKEFELNSCGLVLDWSGRHAYNVFLFINLENKLDFSFFEPQDDCFLKENYLFTGQYALKDGMIIL